VADIASNLARVRATIADAAFATGRSPNDITLIAISKTRPIEAIRIAIAAGQRAFGENTTQEALAKIPHFNDPATDLDWHFIGHLQSNKVKSVAGNFSWMHSLDSLKLAQRLSRLVLEQNNRINLLIEINIAHDSNKLGILPNDLFPLLDQLLQEQLPAVALRGLMAIGPHPATETQRRLAFASLRQLRDAAMARFDLPQFAELSMGMSGDYVEAIKEGSTMLRVGSAIFGERDYSK